MFALTIVQPINTIFLFSKLISEYLNHCTGIIHIKSSLNASMKPCWVVIHYDVLHWVEWVQTNKVRTYNPPDSWCHIYSVIQSEWTLARVAVTKPTNMIVVSTSRILVNDSTLWLCSMYFLSFFLWASYKCALLYVDRWVHIAHSPHVYWTYVVNFYC